MEFVIDDGHTLLPIQGKTTTQPSTSDLASMNVFLDEYADRATVGVLLYAGAQPFWIAKNVLAAPWWMVL
ncbi:MAG: hypothetical protein AABZ29_09760 [Gemmatimonadota bacterium]